MSRGDSLQAVLRWVDTHSVRTRRAVERLPDLSGMRIACSSHLEPKVVPFFAGLLRRGAELFITTCNVSTVRDEVAAHLADAGARVAAHSGMSVTAHEQSFADARAWGPTHLFEMGADLSRAPAPESAGEIRAGIECTGTGIERLASVELRYPVFNVDALPIKEGIHNRHMVGIAAWHAFQQCTKLTLHEKSVLVLGYGPVGRGVAHMARAVGGQVGVVERDPGRALEARYSGFPTPELRGGIASADVVVTATGARRVIGESLFATLKSGCFLANVGHGNDEIDVEALLSRRHREVMPAVTEVELDQGSVYLLAGGALLNLAAGFGDSINAFDVPLAAVTQTIGWLAGDGRQHPPGLHSVPPDVWKPCLAPI